MTLEAPSLVVSSRADRRHSWARAWLRRHSNGFLVLGPTRGAVDDFLRILARDGFGVFGAHRFTLAQLAWLEASPELAERSLARLTPLGSQAMAALAVDSAADRLQILNKVATLPGFPRALSATVVDLRMAGVEADRLAALGGSCGDLGSLLEAYSRALERWSLADSALVFERAARSLRRRGASALDAEDGGKGRELDWRGAPTLCLDLPIRSALEIELLRSLFGLQKEVAMTASRGDDGSLEAASDLLAVEPIDLDADSSPGCALERVQRYVFAPEIPIPEAPFESSAGDDPSFDFFSAGGEGAECVEIARRVRDLAAAGMPFDQIAVFVRQPMAYLPLIEDAMRRASIPTYLSHGASRPDPAGRAFLALLACAAEGLPASRFAEYLSLGQVPVLEPDATPPVREVPWVEPDGDQLVLFSMPSDAASGLGAAVKPEEKDQVESDTSSNNDPAELESPAIAGSLPTPAHWERLLVDAAVVGGADRWRRRLAGLDAELRRQMREVGDEDEIRRAAIERSVERLGHLRAFALPLIDLLDDLPDKARWGTWIERMESIATRALRRPDSVLTLLADLRPLRDVGPVPLGQVRRVLEERLGVLRKKPARRRFGRVFVGTLEEAAGRSFEVVFVPGLAEGVFPRRASEDPLLLDDSRDRLQCGLERQDQRLHAERLLLHLALGAASSRAVLSYPRVDVMLGRARVPSFYALDVLRACEGTVPDLKSLALRAAAAGGSVGGSTGVTRASGIAARPALESAIDNAEYDLALLQDLFRRPPGEARGEGRFLLTVNDHLRRSLHSRARRWRRKWTYADGLVASRGLESSRVALAPFGTDDEETGPDDDGSRATSEVATLLGAESPRLRSFSPTALQHFSACPYRFFLQAILRLRPREDRTGFEQLDPLTRGSIFHQIQFELHNELRDCDLLPFTEENAEAVLEVADRVFERSARSFTEELAPAIPRVWNSELESLRNDLRGWLRQVAQQGAPWSPFRFELAFGLDRSADRDASSVERPVTIAGGRKARGAIDLVEIDRAEKRLRVTDHKTGRPRRERNLVIAGGAVLQPLIYALAAEQLLSADSEAGETGAAAASGVPSGESGEPGRPVVSGRLYYCTQKGEYSSLEVPLNPEGRQAVERVFSELEGALDDCFLPAAPQKDACRWCDYRPVCGPYEERRLERKDKTRLESLEQLRRHR